MPELRNATVTIGVPGLNGTGVTAPEKTDIFNRIAALEAVTPIVNIDDLADVDMTGVAEGDLLQYVGGEIVPYTPEAITITMPAGFVVDGGGAVIASGVKGDLPPFTVGGTITGVVGLADQSGTVSIQIWNDAIANFPPTVADLVTTITITGATRSTVSSVAYTTVSIPFSVGDVLRYSVPSTATSITRVTVGLRIEYEVGP